MTVIIGTRCEDGIVMGADSSATFTQGNQKTIEQPNQEKVKLVDEGCMWAGTGAVGLGQRFQCVLHKNRESLKLKQKREAIEAVTDICKHVVTDFADTRVPPGMFGALLAFYANNSFHLCEYEPSRFQPELKLGDTCFVAMGSGQSIADPFLALLRAIFWKARQPRVNEAIFVTLWVLKHAIEVNPGGIGPPPHIAVLDKSNGGPRTRELNDHEIQEHEDNVEGVGKLLRGYMQNISGAKEAKDVPEMPIAPTHT